MWVHFSADGIHWSDPEPTGACGDRSTVFYNPFRKVWVYSLRHGWGQPRRRRYWEAKTDVVKDAQWGPNSAPPLWCGSDELDPPRDDYKVTPELYNLDCAAYESILLGLFTIWRGQFPERPEAERGVRRLQPRRLELDAGPTAAAFIPISEKQGRLELRQRAIGRRLLSGGRRSALLLLQRPRASATLHRWPCCAATASSRWTPATRKGRSPRGR